MYYEEILKDLNERIKKSEPFSKEHTLLQQLYFTYKQFKAEAVEEVDKWISVSERNPENIGLYEVYCNDGSHLMANVNVVGWWTIPFGNFSGDMGPKFVRDSKEVEREVTHWKERNPLPSAPKQDNNK